MKRIVYYLLAGIMALSAAANCISCAARDNSTGQTVDCAYSSYYSPSTATCITEPVFVLDSWQDVYQDAHFRYASEYSNHWECVIREVLDDEKIVRIPELFCNGDYDVISGKLVGVEYDGTTVKAEEGVRQRELVLDDYVSSLTLYDFSADDHAVDNPENYYDLFTSLIILNPKCIIDIPQIDAIVKLLHTNGLELTIRGMVGSTAELFSKKYDLPFENALKIDGNFIFCKHADHVSVYKWENDDPDAYDMDVKIPAEVDGLPVTEIDDNAFIHKKCFCTVDLPDSVTRIGNNAFHDCGRLTDIHFPDSLQTIGEAAFGFTALQSVIIPDSVTTIGDEAFNNSALESIVISDSVTALGKGVFKMCDSLESARLPVGLTAIPANLFESAYELSDVTIPDGVTVIGESAFNGCHSLTALTLPEHLTEIGEYAFYGCAFSSIAIPDDVSEIGSRAFYGCADLKSITIPKRVKVLRMEVFCICSALECVELPDGLLSIENGAFNSTGLVMIDIPDSCTEIEENTFYSCEHLKRVRLPKNLKTLNDSLFQWCSELTDIQLPETLETIGHDVFGGCAALEKIVIPASVKSIGAEVFSGCEALRSITVKSKDCVFGEFPFGDDYNTAITIFGYPYSTAQQLAAASSFTFKTLDGSPDHRHCNRSE